VGAVVAAKIDQADALRAEWYGLIARLLARAPDRALLASLAAMKGDTTPLGQAIGILAGTAKATTPERVAAEYDALFVGVGATELTPYLSHYLTGFLHDKPLAALRVDLARLGVRRREGTSEPEDHIAALCETMAGLITGAFGAPLDLPAQRAFFETHVGVFAGRFFGDMEVSPSAQFYRPVGAIGRLFFEIETEAFRMVA